MSEKDFDAIDRSFVFTMKEQSSRRQLKQPQWPTCPKCQSAVHEEDLGRGRSYVFCSNPNCDYEGHNT